MPIRSIHTDIHPVPLFVPKAAVIDNTAQVSAIIDTLGYEACEFVLTTGTLTDTDATFTVLVEDSDAADFTGAAAVADAFLEGTEAAASFTFADDNKCRKIGYRGGKRYARVTVTPAANIGDLYLAGIAILGRPASTPTPALS